MSHRPGTLLRNTIKGRATTAIYLRTEHPVRVFTVARLLAEMVPKAAAAVAGDVERSVMIFLKRLLIVDKMLLSQYGAGPPYIRTFHHHGADRVFSPISPPPRPKFRAYRPDYVLDGPARARPCPRPLKGSSYSFSARCRPASGPKPRSATARPLLGPFLAPVA